MKFRTGRRTVVFDAPHFLFLTGVVGFCIWYFFDAYTASDTLENLLLIEPAVIAVVILYFVILRSVIQLVPDETPVTTERLALSPLVQRRIFGGMALLIAYVALMGVIGFDVATVLYVGLTLALLGERRPILLVALPLLFGLVVVYAFRQMVTVPVPTLLDLLS